MTAQIEHLLSLLLCCLPCFALLLFRHLLLLGAITTRGHHHHLICLDIHQSHTSTVPVPAKSYKHLFSSVFSLLQCQSAHKRKTGSTRLLTDQTLHEMQLKALQVSQEIILPARRIEELRRMARRGSQEESLAMLGMEEELPIVRVLRD